MGGQNTGMLGGNDLAGQFLQNTATQPAPLPTIAQPQRRPLPQLPPPPSNPIPAPAKPSAPAGYADMGGQRVGFAEFNKRGMMGPRYGNMDNTFQPEQGNFMDLMKHGMIENYGQPGNMTFAPGVLRSVHNPNHYLIPGQPGYPGFVPGGAGGGAGGPPAMSDFQKMAQALNERGRQTRGS